MPRELFDQTIGLLRRSLDLRTSRHKVISSNIANAETPNFRPQDIPFQKILEGAMDSSSHLRLVRTHPDHLSADFERPLELESSTEEVNLDQEMAKLAENNLMFQAGVQALIKKLEAIRSIIIEGGK